MQIQSDLLRTYKSPNGQIITCIKDRLSCVYKITNLVNKVFYIGSTIDLAARANCHENSLKNNKWSKKLSKDIIKHGHNNFYLEVLEYCSVFDVGEREQYHIDTTNACLIGYNTMRTVIRRKQARPYVDYRRIRVTAEESKKRSADNKKRHDAIEQAWEDYYEKELRNVYANLI